VSTAEGLEGAPFPGAWRALGACRQLPTEIFFPTRGEDVDAARAVCAACPVVSDCRVYAMAVPGLKGIWGGMSESERGRVRHDPGVGTEGDEEDDQDVGALPAEGAAGRAAGGALWATLEVVATRSGSWARVARFASVHSAASTASLLRKGRRAAPPGRWRFEGRRNDDGTSELWACFEGPEAGFGAERSA
jgi:WhiB family transcriptional regulator, redox-sensing transcriptional regulator